MKRIALLLLVLLIVGCDGDTTVTVNPAPAQQSSIEAQSVYGWEAWLLAFGERPEVELFEAGRFYVLRDEFKSVEIHPFGTYPEGHYWTPFGFTADEDRAFGDAYWRVTNGRLGE